MTPQITPRSNVMIGLTHSADGNKIIREPKTLKVGIGFPKGKMCEVSVNADGKWVVRVGKESADGKLKLESLPPVKTREEAETLFRQVWKSAPICPYPRKVPYFQFTRPVMGEDGSEMYVPDFSAIEAHSFVNKNRPGPPTEIDIIFLDDDPWKGGYVMWSPSELKCHGDGVNASRVLSMAATPEEKVLAKDAAAAGLKHFPIVAGCWTCDCPYTKETKDARGRAMPAPCKPSGDIRFQLSRQIRVGGTAFFHTSSFKSIGQIYSSIERIKDLTGGKIAGIPLKMVIRSHKTNHNGQAAIHQNVAIEFRAEDMESLRKNLIEQAWKFREATGHAMLIAAPEEPVFDEMVDNAPMDAQAMADEFYPDVDDIPDSPAPPPPAPRAAVATQNKQDGIAGKLREALVTHTPAPPALNFPWGHKPGMMAVLAEQRVRCGEPAFAAIEEKHGVNVSTLDHTDPRGLAVYQDLAKLPF